MSSPVHWRRLASNDTITRRTLLGGTMATTAALFGVPTTSSARTPPVEAISSERLERHLTEIQVDAGVRRLHQDLLEAGFEPSITEAVGHRASEAATSEPYDVVAIPYQQEGVDEEAVLLWSDSPELPNQIRRIEPPTAGTVTMRSTVLDGPGISTEVIRYDLAWRGFFCRSINWSCLLSVAGAWAGTIAACGACVIDLSRLTCLGCIGAAVSATGGTLGCSFCND